MSTGKIIGSVLGLTVVGAGGFAGATVMANKKLDEINNSKNSQIEKLVTEKKELSTENDTIKVELNGATNEIANKLAENEVLKQENNNLTTQLQDKTNELETKVTENLALQSTIQEHESTISNLETENESLNSNLQTAENEKNNLQSTIDSKNASITSLQNQLAELENSSNEEIADKQSQIDSLNSQISTLNTEVADLTSELNSVNSNIASLQEQLSKNEAEITELKEKLVETLKNVPANLKMQDIAELNTNGTITCTALTDFKKLITFSDIEGFYIFDCLTNSLTKMSETGTKWYRKVIDGGVIIFSYDSSCSDVYFCSSADESIVKLDVQFYCKSSNLSCIDLEDFYIISTCQVGMYRFNKSDLSCKKISNSNENCTLSYKVKNGYLIRDAFNAFKYYSTVENKMIFEVSTQNYENYFNEDYFVYSTRVSNVLSAVKIDFETNVSTVMCDMKNGEFVGNGVLFLENNLHSYLDFKTGETYSMEEEFMVDGSLRVIPTSFGFIKYARNSNKILIFDYQLMRFITFAGENIHNQGLSELAYNDRYSVIGTGDYSGISSARYTLYLYDKLNGTAKEIVNEQSSKLGCKGLDLIGDKLYIFTNYGFYIYYTVTSEVSSYVGNNEANTYSKNFETENYIILSAGNKSIWFDKTDTSISFNLDYGVSDVLENGDEVLFIWKTGASGGLMYVLNKETKVATNRLSVDFNKILKVDSDIFFVTKGLESRYDDSVYYYNQSTKTPIELCCNGIVLDFIKISDKEYMVINTSLSYCKLFNTETLTSTEFSKLMPITGTINSYKLENNKLTLINDSFEYEFDLTTKTGKYIKYCMS